MAAATRLMMDYIIRHKCHGLVGLPSELTEIIAGWSRLPAAMQAAILVIIIASL